MSRALWPALTVAFTTWSGAAMASPEPVERAGGVYHVAICARSIAPATARCHAHLVTDRNGVAQVSSVAQNQAPFGFGPANLRAAYHIAGLGTSKTTIAVVDAYGYENAEADLGVYRAQYGLPACTTANGCFRKLNQNGYASNYPAQQTNWAEESALDLDMVSAMCPNCRIMLVEANTASVANLGAAVNMAVKKGAHVVNNSYGGAETGTVSYEKDYNHLGVAITASSGDNGYGPAFPATSPHVTAVGGTTLNLDPATTRGWSETAWSGAGSGCSVFYAKPAWQKDGGCKMRTVADVAAVADPQTAVAVYGPLSTGPSTWLVFGGTSVSAAIIAGVYGVHGHLATYGANPYSAVAGSLNDVISGSNGTCPVTYLCHAEVGFDGPTGLGTPYSALAF